MTEIGDYYRTNRITIRYACVVERVHRLFRTQCPRTQFFRTKLRETTRRRSLYEIYRRVNSLFNGSSLTLLAIFFVRMTRVQVQYMRTRARIHLIECWLKFGSNKWTSSVILRCISRMIGILDWSVWKFVSRNGFFKMRKKKKKWKYHSFELDKYQK